MYLNCSILEAKVMEDSPPRGELSDLENVITLIAQGRGKG